jgi:endoglycosylceramidase
MTHTAVLTVIFVLFCLLSTQASFIIDTKTHQFIDEDGRESFFHGLNVVYKRFPYYPILDHFDPVLSFSSFDMQFLADMGFNVIRLGVQWPGFEPVRGKYNMTHTNIIMNIINDMAKYGLYALLDFHQDVLSRKFCGEGIPVWATLPSVEFPAHDFPYPFEDPYKVDAEGVPSSSDCARHEWPLYYFTEATATAFQSLYDNKDGIRDDFARFWTFIAKQYGKIPNVLGYEIINEPFAGDIFHHPELILPGIADKKNLQPFYEHISQAIRQVDNATLIFFEPTTWSDFGSGFDRVPGGSDYRNRTVLSYHYYTPPDLSLNQTFTARMSDLERLGCGGMITEFDSSSNPQIRTANIELLQYCNKFKQSWIGWEYKPFINMTGSGWGLFNPDGSVNTTLALYLSQTYAQRIAGVMISQGFDVETGRYILRYTVNENCKLPTVIYLNEKLHYPKGFDVAVVNGSWQKVAQNYIHVKAKGPGDVIVTIIGTYPSKK